MKIITGEVKPFNINEATIERDQFNTIAAALGDFKDGLGLVKFENGTQVIFVEDQETGIKAAYAITGKERLARLVTGIEVADGKIVLTRDGAKGAKSEIAGDEVVAHKKVADEKKAALDNANANLDGLNKDLEAIKALQPVVEELSSRFDKAVEAQDAAQKAHEEAAQKLTAATEAEKKAAEELEEAKKNLAEKKQKESDARANYNAAVEAHIPAGEAQKAWEEARKALKTAAAEEYNKTKAHDAANAALTAATEAEKKTNTTLEAANETLKTVSGEVKALIDQNKYANEFFALTEGREEYFAKLIETREGEIEAATAARDEAAKAYGATFVGAVEGIIAQEKFKALKYALTGRSFVHGIYEVAIDGKKCDKGLLVVAPADNIEWQRDKIGDTTNNTVKTYFIPTVTKDEMEVALLTVESAEELFALGARAVKPRGGIQVTKFAHNGNEIICYAGSKKNDKGEYTSDKKEIYRIADKEQVLLVANGGETTLKDENGNETKETVVGLKQHYARTSTPFEVLNDATKSTVKSLNVTGFFKKALLFFAILGIAAVGAKGAYDVARVIKANNEQTTQYVSTIDTKEHELQVAHLTGIEDYKKEAAALGTKQANENKISVSSKQGEIVLNVNNIDSLDIFSHPNPAPYSYVDTETAQIVEGKVELTDKELEKVNNDAGYKALQVNARSYSLGYNYIDSLLAELNATDKSLSARDAEGNIVLSPVYVNLLRDSLSGFENVTVEDAVKGAYDRYEELSKAQIKGIEVETYDRTKEMEDMKIDAIIAGEDGKFYVIDDGVLTEYTAEEGYEYTNDAVPLKDVIDHATENGKYAQSTYAKNVYATATSVEGNSKATLVEYRAVENDAVREGEAVVVRKSGSTTDIALATAVGYAQDKETKEAGYGDVDLPRDARNYTTYSSVDEYETVYGDDGASL